MSLGYTEGFRAFEAQQTLGKREGYYHGRQSASTSGVRHFQCAGGEPSNSGLTLNQMPAIAAGSIKKIISSIIQTGGGRLDVYSSVAGAAILRGNNPTVGKVTFDFDHPFVLGDLLSWQFQRNSSNGTSEYGAFAEIEWDEVLDNVQHWYGGNYRTASFGNLGFWEIGEMTQHAIFPLTPRKEFQRPMLQSGVILDYGYYGDSPVGVDVTPFYGVEINGSLVDSFIVTQTGSKVFSNNVGVNISFAKGDLINLTGLCATTSDLMEGLPTMRIQFD